MLPTQYAVAEMCALLPIESTIFHFAARFVDPAFAFAIAGNYFYGGAIVVALEATAAASLLGFWSSVNSGVWIAVALVTNLFVNIYTIRWYGEVESLFAIFKILLITGLILMTIITALEETLYTTAMVSEHGITLAQCWITSQQATSEGSLDCFDALYTLAWSWLGLTY